MSMPTPEICTTVAGSKQHLSRALGPDRHAPRHPGRYGRTMCGHAGFDQERVDFYVADQQMRRCKPIADLPPCRSCAQAAGEVDRTTFKLTEDQLCAVRELLGLVHYDTLANEWLRLLPKEFRPAPRTEGAPDA